MLCIISGSGGLSVANQIYKRFNIAGKPLNAGDIAVIDAAEYHYYQVGHPVCMIRVVLIHVSAWVVRIIFVLHPLC